MFKWRFTFDWTSSEWSKETYDDKFQAFVGALAKVRDWKDPDRRIASIVVKDFSKKEDI